MACIAVEMQSRATYSLVQCLIVGVSSLVRGCFLFAVFRRQQATKGGHMALNNKLNAYTENLKLLVIKHKKVPIAAALALIVIISMIPVLFSQHQNTPSSTAASCDLKNMNGKMTCEEYEKDHKYRCEYSLSTGDKSGFDEKKLDDRTCQDLGYTWTNKGSSSSESGGETATSANNYADIYTNPSAHNGQKFTVTGKITEIIEAVQDNTSMGAGFKTYKTMIPCGDDLSSAEFWLQTNDDHRVNVFVESCKLDKTLSEGDDVSVEGTIVNDSSTPNQYVYMSGSVK